MIICGQSFNRIIQITRTSYPSAKLRCVSCPSIQSHCIENPSNCTASNVYYNHRSHTFGRLGGGDSAPAIESFY